MALLWLSSAFLDTPAAAKFHRSGGYENANTLSRKEDKGKCFPLSGRALRLGDMAVTGSVARAAMIAKSPISRRAVASRSAPTPPVRKEQSQMH